MNKKLLLTAIFSGSIALLMGQDVLLEEDFSKQSLPAGWKNIDNTGGGEWQFTNPGSRDIQTTTAANGFAIFDSDNYGDDSQAENAELHTSAFNAAAYDSAVTLEFSHYYYDGDVPSTSAYGAVEVSGDGGATFTEVTRFELINSENGAIEAVDLTAVASGQSEAVVRFVYNGSWRYYWAVDDVKITGLIKPGSPPPATPPVAVRDSAECDTSSSVDIYVVLNDSAKDLPIDTSSVSIVANPKFGNATVSDSGFVTYEPLEGFSGLDSFSYTITDTANNKSNEAFVVVDVSPKDIVNTSIENTALNHISVYPNPANPEFSLSGLNINSGTLEIFTLSGKLIERMPLNSMNKIKTPESLTNGVYLINVSDGVTTYTTRLFIQK